MKTLLLIMLCLASVNAQAAKEAKNGKTDPRIKTVVYNERDVIVLHGHYGYSTHVVFADDEEITYLSPGDALAWQIVPKNNNLFLKPMEDNAETNLTVLTNKRRYTFELRASEAISHRDISLSFTVQFSYPEDDMLAQLQRTNLETRKRATEVVPGRKLNPETLNHEYTMRGSEDIAPTRVFDDGEYTYFQFPKEVDTPAIFLVDRNKRESIVNYHVKGSYIVVQRIGRQYILRSGKTATCIYNEAYRQGVMPTQIPEKPSHWETLEKTKVSVLPKAE